MSAGHNIDCFECNSVTDRRCGDPFNYTLTIEDMPPLAKCQGCCVKLVQNLGTDYKSVRLMLHETFIMQMMLLLNIFPKL